MSNINPKPTKGFTSSEFPKDSQIDIVLLDIIKKRVGKNNLLLGILETVTISRINGIGETMYFAHKTIEEIKKTIQSDYEEIIKFIETKTTLGTPVKYFNWYEQSEHYYVISENSGVKNYNDLTDDKLAKHSSKQVEKGKDDDAIVDFEKKLTSQELENFYIEYTKQFLCKVWFKDIPHYFIFAKPIATIDIQTKAHIPLGNLYIVIGTKQKVKLRNYQLLVKDLRNLWFQRLGSRILKEFSQRKRSDKYIPKKEESKTLSNRLEAVIQDKDKTIPKVSLNDYYYAAFDLDSFSQLREDYLIKSNDNIISTLINNYENKKNITDSIKDFYDYKFADKDIISKSANAKILYQIKEESIIYFLLLISKRRVALALLLVFDFTLEEAHKALVSGSGEVGVNHKSFFNTNLFIFYSNNKTKNGVDFTSIVKTLSEKDMYFLKEIVTKIKTKDHNFSCHIRI